MEPNEQEQLWNFLLRCARSTSISLKHFSEWNTSRHLLNAMACEKRNGRQLIENVWRKLELQRGGRSEYGSLSLKQIHKHTNTSTYSHKHTCAAWKRISETWCKEHFVLCQATNWRRPCESNMNKFMHLARGEKTKDRRETRRLGTCAFYNHRHTQMHTLRRLISILSSLTSARYRALAHLFVRENNCFVIDWFFMLELNRVSYSLGMKQRTTFAGWIDSLTNKSCIYSIASIRFESIRTGIHRPTHTQCVNIFLTQADGDTSFQTAQT